MKSSRTAALILQYGRFDLTRRCLESLLAMTGETPDLFLIDNPSNTQARASANAFFKALAAEDPGRFLVIPEAIQQPPFEDPRVRLRLIPAPRNLGFGGGINLGLKAALEDPLVDFFWILNNDVIATPKALESLKDTMIARPDLGVLASTLLDPGLPMTIQAVGGRYNPWLGTTSPVLSGVSYDSARQGRFGHPAIDYGVGAALLVRREALEKVGLFPEDYFLYFEDLDWAERLRQRAPQYRLDYSLDSALFHEEGGTTGAGHRGGKHTTPLADYYAQRNRLRFARRWYPRYYPLVHLSQLGVVLNRLRRKEWRLAALALSLFLGGRHKCPEAQDPEAVFRRGPKAPK